jgi:hypothetical protein
MTNEKTIREFIQNKVNDKDQNRLTYIDLIYDLQEFCKHLQTEAINYTRCSTQLRVAYEQGFCKWAESNCISTKKDLYEYNNRSYSLKQLENLYDKEICKNP